MKPRTGRLRTPVTFLRPTDTPDGGGGSTTAFAPDDPAHVAMADFQPVSTGTAMQAEALEIMRRARLIVRLPAAPAGFDVAWRVNVRGIEYAVLSVTDQEGDGRYLTAILARVS